MIEECRLNDGTIDAVVETTFSYSNCIQKFSSACGGGGLIVDDVFHKISSVNLMVPACGVINRNDRSLVIASCAPWNLDETSGGRNHFQMSKEKQFFDIYF